MDDIAVILGKIGIIPVAAIEDSADAIPLRQALLAGVLPYTEIAFRTARRDSSRPTGPSPRPRPGQISQSA